MTHEIVVVLDHVILECLRWQCPIAHLLHKFVVSVMVPGRFDIFALQDIFHKATAATTSVDIIRYVQGEDLTTETEGLEGNESG